MLENGITISDKNGNNRINLFTAYGLLLTDEKIGKPAERRTYIEIPGREIPYDMTELIAGYPQLSNRTLEFTLMYKGAGRWEEIADDLYRLWHNVKVRIIRDDDKAFFYYGRCTVDGWESVGGFPAVKITLDAYPYRYDVTLSRGPDNWLTTSPYIMPESTFRDVTRIATTTSGVMYTVPKYGFKVVPWLKNESAQATTVTISPGAGTFELPGRSGWVKATGIIIGEQPELERLTLKASAGMTYVQIDCRGGRI